MIKLKQECEISINISKKILCLPIYAELENDVLKNIIKIVKENL